MKKTVFYLSVSAALVGCAAPEINLSNFAVLNPDTMSYPSAQADIQTPINLIHQGPPPEPAPAPVKVVRKVEITSAINFDFGGFRLPANAANIASDLAHQFQFVNAGTITATGYTDSIGSPLANKQLSLRRAQSVKALLIKRGLPADRISVVGAGSDNFLVPPSSCRGTLRDQAVCQAPNRRVEIRLSGTIDVLEPGK
jgi:outer membrane protein OmpA-like peptidoglycan-associated protein